MKIKILHLYPDLLNLYGDKGNIECLRHRLVWRGIDAEVEVCTSDNNEADITSADIIFLGGGSDKEQKLAAEKLIAHKDAIKEYAENDGVILAVCGGYQLLGNYYKMKDATLSGLEILDIYTEQGEKRLIGNITLQSDIIDSTIVGFENHGGRTYGSEKYQPLGKVITGYGNSDAKDYEGIVYKNIIATYLHGPLLPKNPKLCDYVLEKALRKKYPEFQGLTPLDDGTEEKANEYMVKRLTSN